MREEVFRVVLRVRVLIYVCMLFMGLLLACSSLIACPCEVTENDGEKSEFWPPDLVPHPHPPGTGPSGPKDKGDLAEVRLRSDLRCNINLNPSAHYYPMEHLFSADMEDP